MKDKRKILITGAAGYIGSITTATILENSNYEIVALDNFSNSRESSYELIEAITGKTFPRINADVNNPGLLKILQPYLPIDGIIHFAALKSVPESTQKPVLYYQNNICGLINMLNIAKETNIQYFIFSSSCSVYGNISPEKLPVKEDTPLSETECPYATTKKIGEEILRDFTKFTPCFKSIALRYFNPVGAHLSGKLGEWPRKQPENLLPVITETAIGLREKMYVYGNDYPTPDGTCIRDYVHVVDIARAHLLALEYLWNLKHKNSYFDIFNLGTGHGVSVKQAIDRFEEINDTKVNYEFTSRRPGDVAAIYSDCTKARTILGWEPQLSLDDMVRTAWQWQKFLTDEK
ncbi:MAG: UDP-glucose 4-epimerase [Vicingaceae bacterium]|nr:MAG: UDP-glucose 4-epimerase [Vicingaceae bacterium]